MEPGAAEGGLGRAYYAHYPDGATAAAVGAGGLGGDALSPVWLEPDGHRALLAGLDELLALQARHAVTRRAVCISLSLPRRACPV